MRNKIAFLILALIVNFSPITKAYSDPLMDEVCFDKDSIDNFDSNDYLGTKDSCRYFSLGVGPVIFIPNVGVGYRERFSQFGYDTALSFSTIGYVHQLSAHLVGHYYLDSSGIYEPYLGFGLIGSGVFTNHKEGGFTLSPDFVFGKGIETESKNRHFIEMHIAVPTMWIDFRHANSSYFPLMYIKYGIAF